MSKACLIDRHITAHHLVKAQSARPRDLWRHQLPSREADGAYQIQGVPGRHEAEIEDRLPAGRQEGAVSVLGVHAARLA